MSWIHTSAAQTGSGEHTAIIISRFNNISIIKVLLMYCKGSTQTVNAAARTQYRPSAREPNPRGDRETIVGPTTPTGPAPHGSKRHQPAQPRPQCAGGVPRVQYLPT